MIYACILLCAFISQFTYTLGIQIYSPYNKINQEPEVIPVEHTFHTDTITVLSIKIKHNGTERKYILQSAEGYFAGKDTKVWLAMKNGERHSYTLQKGIMEKVNISFYHDQKTQSAIAHTVNEAGISEFNGIIDSDKVIQPLNDHNRYRRDVPLKSLNENSDNNFENLHVISKQEKTSFYNNNNNNKYNNKIFKTDPRLSNIDLGIPETVYPEILVYVDKSIFEHFNRDIVKAVAYTLTFWNGVDLFYRELENPAVRLNIAGIILFQDELIPLTELDVEEKTRNNQLFSFGKYMYREEFTLGKDYDIAVLFTDNFEQIPVIGVAYTEGVCYKLSVFVKSVAVVTDNFGFFGIHTAVHELGHLFGLKHDGDKYDLKWSESRKYFCDNYQGFIMATMSSTSLNKYKFSPCSKVQMTYHLSKNIARCVRNNPADNRMDKQILRILPGKFMTLDEQCQRSGFERASIASVDICLRMICRNGSTITVTNEGALEGSPCDTDKFCLNGECVKVQFTKDDENSAAKLLFPAPFYRNPKTKKMPKELCLEAGFKDTYISYRHDCTVYCRIEFAFDEKIKAENGTLCDKGYCLGGKCVPYTSSSSSTTNSYDSTSTTVGDKKVYSTNAARTIKTSVKSFYPPTSTTVGNSKAKITTGRSTPTTPATVFYSITSTTQSTTTRSQFDITIEHCEKFGIKNVYRASQIICLVYCYKKDNRGDYYTIIPAEDGTLCYIGYCSSGICVRYPTTFSSSSTTNSYDLTSTKTGRSTSTTSKIIVVPSTSTIQTTTATSFSTSATQKPTTATSSTTSTTQKPTTATSSTTSTTQKATTATSSTTSTTQSTVVPNNSSQFIPDEELTRKHCEENGIINVFKTLFLDCMHYCLYSDGTGDTIDTYSGVAKDGTLCDINKTCQNGTCVENIITTTRSTTSVVLPTVVSDPPSQHLPDREFSEKLCEEDGFINIFHTHYENCEHHCLYYQDNGNVGQHSVTAKDGTLCDISKHCQNGTCVDSGSLLIV